MSILDHTFPPELDSVYNKNLANQLANTYGAIASLNQLDRLLHNPDLLMHPILTKEAESSSQLEGTQASIDDAYKIDIMEQTEEVRNDAVEIRNYEKAMYAGIKILERLPLDKFLIREVHKILMSGAHGRVKKPGDFRKSDVWIGEKGTKKGDARYLPPDATQVEPLVESLIQYINNSEDTHPLIVCGVLHHRFEAIHPFEDGNGRTGRILISLFLMKKGILNKPVLYPSGYFEKNKSRYMEALSKVDKTENWYEWLVFFLKGLEQQAQLSLDIGLNIDTLFKKSKYLIKKEKANLGLNTILEYMFTRYFVTAPIVNHNTGIPLTTCKRYLEKLSSKGIISDLGIHNRQRVYSNLKLLDLLRNI